MRIEPVAKSNDALNAYTKYLVRINNVIFYTRPMWYKDEFLFEHCDSYYSVEEVDEICEVLL